jgi:hypothetical protein
MPKFFNFTAACWTQSRSDSYASKILNVKVSREKSEVFLEFYNTKWNVVNTIKFDDENQFTKFCLNLTALISEGM